ncbi:extracellular solute-binding protein [Fodinicola acaciae]|uniref:extracellular solute-binding protein n=1 Tax=Fodinicola acaciae TaxID=2681555 RepID=UPI0013D3A71C|nr:extracellular solute-binding protein [Fodinicola acaciae]
MSQNSTGLSRRALLGLGAGIAATAVAGGCSSGGSRSAAGGTLTVPTYLPARTFPGVITSSVPGVPYGYSTYPRPLVATVKEVPGRGSTITSYTMTWAGQPTPLAHNKYWQGLNKRLGVTWKPTIAPADGYEQKLATLLAGGDLPDLTILRPCAAANSALRQGAFANLNDVLGGSGIEKYPNIGWTRPEQWRQVLVDNTIYGIPLDVPICNQQVRIRMDWAKKLGFTAPPANAEEFHKFLTGVPKANVGRNGQKAFGLATFGVTTNGNPFINQMFKVPNIWSGDGNELTHMYESEQFAKALEFAARVWKDGGFHPDALALSTQNQKELSLFTGGQLSILSISMQGWHQAPYNDTLRAANGGIVPYVVPGADGGVGTYWLGGSVYGLLAISAKAGSDDKRLDEILRVVNWLKAPFGSAENTYMLNGAENEYWTWKNGAPTFIDESAFRADASTLTYGYRPNVWYVAGEPNAARDIIAYCEQVVRTGVANPCDGLSSQVADRLGPALDEVASTYLTQIVTGRRPVTDVTAFAAEWRKRGGDQVRDDLRKALSERGGK